MPAPASGLADLLRPPSAPQVRALLAASLSSGLRNDAPDNAMAMRQRWVVGRRATQQCSNAAVCAAARQSCAAPPGPVHPLPGSDHARAHGAGIGGLLHARAPVRAQAGLLAVKRCSTSCLAAGGLWWYTLWYDSWYDSWYCTWYRRYRLCEIRAEDYAFVLLSRFHNQLEDKVGRGPGLFSAFWAVSSPLLFLSAGTVSQCL